MKDYNLRPCPFCGGNDEVNKLRIEVNELKTERKESTNVD